MSFDALLSKKLMLASAVASSMLLTACGSDDDDNKRTAITGEAFAAFTTASDYSGSELVYGNVTDLRTSTNTVLSTTETNFGIAGEGNRSSLYYLDRTNGLVSNFDISSTPGGSDYDWQYSVNETESDSTSNPYTVVHESDDAAWVVRYGSSSVLKINPNATTAEEFQLAEVDLSAYTVEGATYPRMSDAVIYNNTLFVVMQRLDAYWAPMTAYIAAIDLTSMEEIDTDTSTDGLNGIELNITNPMTLEIENGILFVSGHGPYGSNTGTGVDMVDATTYAVTNLISDTDSNLSEYNAESEAGVIQYHIGDVEPVNDNLVYFTVALEQGYGTTLNNYLYQIDPTSDDAATLVDITAGLNSDTTLGSNDELTLTDLESDSEDRLWVGVANSDNPGLLVLDTDTNSQNNEYVELNLLPRKVVILNAE
ncbi:hypothetical protein [Oceanobacter kriegii]|uniref:hypothetical protein n=1 Tax=Oceanobacter kriegii TaxID=64972 RepID=UPI0004125AFB|nr:hypothetical protein [Oceanobacter kriegii]